MGWWSRKNLNTWCFLASKPIGHNYTLNFAWWKDHSINVGNKCLTDLFALAHLNKRALNQPSDNALYPEKCKTNYSNAGISLSPPPWLLKSQQIFITPILCARRCYVYSVIPVKKLSLSLKNLCFNNKLKTNKNYIGIRCVERQRA